ncbi:hypothetical protein H0H87_004832, partial [Tephrocybe sp. NHM501043]
MALGLGIMEQVLFIEGLHLVHGRIVLVGNEASGCGGEGAVAVGGRIGVFGVEIDEGGVRGGVALGGGQDGEAGRREVSGVAGGGGGRRRVEDITIRSEA